MERQEGEPRITDHAYMRSRERLGLNEPATRCMAKRALRRGIGTDHATGGLRLYIDGLQAKYRTANNVRIYISMVFVFNVDLLITVYVLPPQHLTAVEKIKRRIKKLNRKREREEASL